LNKLVVICNHCFRFLCCNNLVAVRFSLLVIGWKDLVKWWLWVMLVV